MKSKMRKILLLIIIFIVSLDTFAQQTVSNTENTKSNQKIYLTEPFAISKDSLIPLFQGNDITEVYSVLNNRLKEKGEFETTAEYTKRISESFNKPILGSLTKDDFLAFVIEDLEKKFNADKQSLNVKIELSDSWSISIAGGTVFGGKGGYGIECKNLKKIESSYEATNSLGAKRTVEKFTSENYYTVLNNYNTFPLKDESSYKTLSSEIAMDTQTAIRVKDNLKVLLVGKLVKPYIRNSIRLIDPTFSDPEEGVIKNKALIIDVEEIWYFDSESGKVFLKIKSKV